MTTPETAVSEKPATKPKATRARRRYLQFVAADYDCSFGEWLRNQWYKPNTERRLAL